jgi:arylsulfatase A-like enzyme
MKHILISLWLLAVQASTAKQPNILFILTDDQGYGDVARHGHPLLKTPHQDTLHDQSVRFQNFYVSPSCSPTRAALMTGMHEFRSGVTHTTEPREHLDLNAVILPQLLKSAGYRTGFIGKWHLGNDGPYNPTNRGFDWNSTNGGAATVHFDPVIIRNRVREKRTGYREDILFDEAMAFIDDAKGSPFFCYLATYSPHAPVKAPDAFKAPFVGKVDPEEADFLGMVANLDYNLGRITKHLKDRGLEKDTIIV